MLERILALLYQKKGFNFLNYETHIYVAPHNIRVYKVLWRIQQPLSGTPGASPFSLRKVYMSWVLLGALQTIRLYVLFKWRSNNGLVSCLHKCQYQDSKLWWWKSIPPPLSSNLSLDPPDCDLCLSHSLIKTRYRLLEWFAAFF